MRKLEKRLGREERNLSRSNWHYEMLQRLRRHRAELDAMLQLFDYSCTEVHMIEELKSSFAQLEEEQADLFEKAQEEELDSIC